MNNFHPETPSTLPEGSTIINAVSRFAGRRAVNNALSATVETMDQPTTTTPSSPDVDTIYWITMPQTDEHPKTPIDALLDLAANGRYNEED